MNKIIFPLLVLSVLLAGCARQEPSAKRQQAICSRLRRNLILHQRSSNMAMRAVEMRHYQDNHCYNLDK